MDSRHPSPCPRREEGERLLPAQILRARRLIPPSLPGAWQPIPLNTLVEVGGHRTSGRDGQWLSHDGTFRSVCPGIRDSFHTVRRRRRMGWFVVLRMSWHAETIGSCVISRRYAAMCFVACVLPYVSRRMRRGSPFSLAIRSIAYAMPCTNRQNRPLVAWSHRPMVRPRAMSLHRVGRDIRNASACHSSVAHPCAVPIPADETTMMLGLPRWRLGRCCGTSDAIALEPLLLAANLLCC